MHGYADDGEYVSPKVVAGMLGVSAEAVRRWCRSGKLPAIQLGGYLYRIRRADVRAFMEPKYKPPPRTRREASAGHRAAVASLVRDGLMEPEDG
jgi:excisionase family DNA binding protein